MENDDEGRWLGHLELKLWQLATFGAGELGIVCISGQVESSQPLVLILIVVTCFRKRVYKVKLYGEFICESFRSFCNVSAYF